MDRSAVDKTARATKELIGAFRRYPSTRRLIGTWLAEAEGTDMAESWKAPVGTAAADAEALQAEREANPLWNYFAGTTDGPGIWKWEHYFEIYHRHLARFIGSPVDLLEVGIFSGGSLGMWHDYFQGQCHIYGVDIEESCKAYESDDVSVFIGDQEDRSFWSRVKSEVPGIDVLIDDGGHTPDQQIVTLQEMLPFLRPGGVYVCEDVTGIHHRFTSFASGLVDQLNDFHQRSGHTPTDFVSPASTFQSAVHSIHFYPYVVVIEKHRTPPTEFVSSKRGSEWQPWMPR
jgi:hypothetical protein